MLSFNKRHHKLNNGEDFEELTSLFHHLQISAVSKAAALRPSMSDVTIGPKSRYNESHHSTFTTSTPLKPIGKSPPSASHRGLGQRSSLLNLSSIEKMTSTAEQKKTIAICAVPDVRTPSPCDNIIQMSPCVAETSNGPDHNSSLNSRDRSREIEATTVRKLLKQFDVQRHESVEEVMKIRVELMESESKRIAESVLTYRDALRQKAERRAERDRLELQKKLRAQVSEVLTRQQKLGIADETSATQRISELSNKVQEVERRKRQANETENECLKAIDKILTFQKHYRKKYEEIVGINRKIDVNDRSIKYAEELEKANATNETFLALVEKFKNFNSATVVSSLDAQIASTLFHQINDIHHAIKKEAAALITRKDKEEKEKAEKQKDVKMKAKKEEAEKEAAKKEAAEKEEKMQLERQVKNVTEEESDKNALKGCVDQEFLANYEALQSRLTEVEKNLESFVKDDRYKQFRFDCQKAVNTPVNAISPQNFSHLNDKYRRLASLLNGESVVAGDGRVSAASHPLGIIFCTNLLAKKFVRQGSRTVASKPSSAFASAAVIVALWVEFPAFGQLLLAHFQRDCPYLVPAFWPQLTGQSDVEYYKRLGYEYTDGGVVEKQDMFLKRMSGMMHLYAAILVTPLRKDQRHNRGHPLGVCEAWRFITATLNLEPRLDVSATLVYDFLEVAGSVLYHYYGFQFQKVLHLLCKEYLPRVGSITPDGCDGPVSRLKVFLERILSEGLIPPPVGMLEPDFW